MLKEEKNKRSHISKGIKDAIRRYYAEQRQKQKERSEQKIIGYEKNKSKKENSF